MRGEVLRGVERRRRWSDAQKLEIARASWEAVAVVSEVARRFDVTRQQVYDFRRAARGGELFGMAPIVGFIEVAGGPTLGPVATPIPGASEPGDGAGPMAMPVAVTVEVVLGGRCLRVPAALPADDLRRLIRAVEGA